MLPCSLKQEGKEVVNNKRKDLKAQCNNRKTVAKLWGWRGQTWLCSSSFSKESYQTEVCVCVCVCTNKPTQCLLAENSVECNERKPRIEECVWPRRKGCDKGCLGQLEGGEKKRGRMHWRRTPLPFAAGAVKDVDILGNVRGGGGKSGPHTSKGPTTSRPYPLTPL